MKQKHFSSMMKTLQELALQAAPNPALMARTFLVPGHPPAKQLEARDYEEQSNKFRQHNRIKFRYVVKAWYAAKTFTPVMLHS